MPRPLDLLAAELLLQLVSLLLLFGAPVVPHGVVLVGYRRLPLHDLVNSSGLAALEWGSQLL